MQTQYDGKLPLRGVLDNRLRGTRQLLEDTKLVALREREQRKRDCVLERGTVDHLTSEVQQLRRQVEAVQMDISLLRAKHAVSVKSTTTVLADTQRLFIEALEDIGVPYSIASSEAACVYETANTPAASSAPPSPTVRKSAANPFTQRSLPPPPARTASASNPFAHASPVLVAHKPRTVLPDSLELVPSRGASDSSVNPAVSTMAPSDPAQSSARAVIPAARSPSPVSVDAAGSTDERAELDFSEHERGVYVLPMCMFDGIPHALLVCASSQLEVAHQRVSALTPISRQRSSVFKPKPHSSDAAASVAATELTWQFITGVCRTGEPEMTAALRLFREKASRLSDDDGFDAHCLTSAVVGSSFGSKTDIDPRTSAVRVSKMLSVMLPHSPPNVPMASYQLPATHDMYCHWFTIEDIDKAIWKFQDEQTSMFIRLGLMLSSEQLLSVTTASTEATHRRTPSRSTQSSKSDSAPSHDRASVDAIRMHIRDTSADVSEDVLIPVPCQLRPRQPPPSVIGIGISDNDERILLSSVKSLSAACDNMEKVCRLLHANPCLTVAAIAQVPICVAGVSNWKSIRR